MKWRRAYLPSLLALLVIPGCVSLKREPPRKRMFGLEAVRPVDLRMGAEGIGLQIRTALIALPYDSRGFVYRMADGTWQEDFHNEFFMPPAVLLTEQVRRFMVGMPGAPRIVEAGTREKATCILYIRVNELFGDYPHKGSRHGVLEMEFAIDAAEPSADVVWFERSYRREIPFEDSGADGLVAAWNTALEEILTELVGDLNAHGWPMTDG